MSRGFLSCVLFAGLSVAGLPMANASVMVTVPGTANPWLAGMPNGSVAGNRFDTAPGESPVQVTGISVNPGTVLLFSASGTVGYSPIAPQSGPDGLTASIYSRTPGPENGIADMDAPIEALLGVFLDNNQPSGFSPPSVLNFSIQTERDFNSISPMLRQPFFIGDGLTSSSVVQQFVIPAGATRFYLGTMDGQQWSDNVGSFTVTVTALPEPNAAWLLGVGCVSLLRRRRV